jgi:hypothetical protein
MAQIEDMLRDDPAGCDRLYRIATGRPSKAKQEAGRKAGLKSGKIRREKREARNDGR